MSKRGDQTRALIYEEAQKLFAEKGFKEVTMQDICERTGLSRGGLYRHFGSTEEVFEHLIGELMQTQEDEIAVKIGRCIPATEILDEILERYCSEMIDSGHSLSLAIYEFFSSRQYGKEDNALYRQYLWSKAMWESLIRYGTKTGEFKPVDEAAVFDLIVFAYQGVRLYSQLIPINPEIPGHITGLVRTLLLT